MNHSIDTKRATGIYHSVCAPRTTIRTSGKYPTANRILRSAVCLLSGWLLASCIAHHGVLVADVDPLDWLPGDTVSVAYLNPDSTGLYDLHLLVRYNDNLPPGPLPIRIETLTPDSLTLRETVTLHIPPRNAGELSEHNQTFYEYEIPYRIRVRFSHSGTYRFRFSPASRVSDPLAGITAAGIRISPTTEK